MNDSSYKFKFLFAVRKSLIAFSPIMMIRFKLIELTPPFLGLKEIGIHLHGCFLSTKIELINTFDKKKSSGIWSIYFSKTLRFINLNGVFASSI